MSDCSSSSCSSAALSTPLSTPPDLHQNSINPSTPWLVQKFGGTSVGKFPVKIASEVVLNYINGNKVAIVCSARSGSTKSLGTTNLLLRAASEAVKLERPQKALDPASPPPLPRSRSYSWDDCPASGSPRCGPLQMEFNATADLIRDEHFQAAREAIQDIDIRREFEEEIMRDCDWLKSFLFASQIINEVSPKSQDSIIGLGEKMACKFMTAVLRDQGIDAEYVSLEDIVPEGEEDGRDSLSQDFYDRVAAAVGERVKQCGPRVPVVTGFFGPVPGSLLSQVGRGYTDLLSSLLAVGLEAAELQIWKEVDGIFTADPRKVPTARVLPIITPDEAAELTYYGSEVVHPFTMEQVIRRKIPIRIKNVQNPPGQGTVIFPDTDTDHPQVENPYVLELQLQIQRHSHRKLPTAVTIKESIQVININSNKKSGSHGFLAGIFGALDKFGVVVDLISTSEVHVSMAIEDSGKSKVIQRLLRELRKSGEVTTHSDMAILSLVGKGMRNVVGVAGKMFTTLGTAGINIEMISQGASEINISCVIEAKDAVKSLNLIHHSCLQIPNATRIGPWLF